MAILIIMAGEISELIDFFSFTAWIFYGGSMIMVILLRFKRKDLERPYKVLYKKLLYKMKNNLLSKH